MLFHLQAIEVNKQVNNRLFNLPKLWELATMEMMNLRAQLMVMSKMCYLLEVMLGKKGHGQASEDPECCHECCDQRQHHVQHGWDAENAWMAEHWKSSKTSNLLLDGKGSPRESCPFYEDMIGCNVSNYYTSRQGHLLWLITSLPIYLLMLCMRLTCLHTAMRPEFL